MFPIYLLYLVWSHWASFKNYDYYFLKTVCHGSLSWSNPKCYCIPYLSVPKNCYCFSKTLLLGSWEGPSTIVGAFKVCWSRQQPLFCHIVFSVLAVWSLFKQRPFPFRVLFLFFLLVSKTLQLVFLSCLKGKFCRCLSAVKASRWQ